MSKLFALVGNWFYKPAPKGLSVYELDQDTGKLNFVDTFYNDYGLGFAAKGVTDSTAYMVNECEAQRGCVGGGGYIMSVCVDEKSGQPEILGEAKTLLSFPAYFCVSNSGKYGVTVHMGNGSHITKVVSTPDGGFTNTVLYDDAAVVLFRMNEDGSVGAVCDVSVHRGEEAPGAHMMAHLHSVTSDPQGKLFFVCDKGLDRVTTYHIDEEAGKLIRLCDVDVETGVVPRYSVFHKELPLVYVNNERLTEVFTFRVDYETGAMTRIARTSLLEDPNVDMTGLRVEASDIQLSEDGKHLYVAVRGLDMIAVFDVEADGSLTLKQNAKTGSSPRGLCFTPNGRFMYSMNTETAHIATFAVEENGLLTPVGEAVSAPSPACMVIIQAKE